MPRTTASSSSRKPARATLDQARVVRAAVGIANAHGTDALSMRALAGALGVEAMSLYSHVPSKEVLLGLMAAHVMESIDIPPRTLPPLKRLQRLATDLREAAHAHPAVFPLVVLAPLDMRAAVRPTEIALQAFLDAGLSDQRAIRSQRVFLSFVRGYLLWEIGGFTAGRWRASDASSASSSTLCPRRIRIECSMRSTEIAVRLMKPRPGMGRRYMPGSRYFRSEIGTVESSSQKISKNHRTAGQPILERLFGLHGRQNSCRNARRKL